RVPAPAAPRGLAATSVGPRSAAALGRRSGRAGLARLALGLDAAVELEQFLERAGDHADVRAALLARQARVVAHAGLADRQPAGAGLGEHLGVDQRPLAVQLDRVDERLGVDLERAVDVAQVNAEQRVDQ